MAKGGEGETPAKNIKVVAKSEIGGPTLFIYPGREEKARE